MSRPVHPHLFDDRPHNIWRRIQIKEHAIMQLSPSSLELRSQTALPNILPS